MTKYAVRVMNTITIIIGTVDAWSNLTFTLCTTDAANLHVNSSVWNWWICWVLVSK